MTGRGYKTHSEEGRQPALEHDSRVDRPIAQTVPTRTLRRRLFLSQECPAHDLAQGTASSLRHRRSPRLCRRRWHRRRVRSERGERRSPNSRARVVGDVVSSRELTVGVFALFFEPEKVARLARRAERPRTAFARLAGTTARNRPRSTPARIGVLSSLTSRFATGASRLAILARVVQQARKRALLALFGILVFIPAPFFFAQVFFRVGTSRSGGQAGRGTASDPLGGSRETTRTTRRASFLVRSVKVGFFVLP